MKRTEREQQEKEAVKRRLIDMALGAYGDHSAPDFDGNDFSGMCNELGLEAFGRWIGAIKNAWPEIEQKLGFLFKAGELHGFDSLDDAVEVLWRNGAR